jgi:hypothetical protein
VTTPAEDPNKLVKPRFRLSRNIRLFSNDAIKKYMYDPKDKSIVFTLIHQGLQQPTVIFKIRIKETMVTGDKDVNWTAQEEE